MGTSRLFTVLLALTALLAAGPAGAADPGVIELRLEVGQEATVSGGPIREFMCDDGSLVKVQYAADGVALVGLQAGASYCSFRDAVSVRRVLHVVVKDPPPAPPRPPPAKTAPPPGESPVQGGG